MFSLRNAIPFLCAGYLLLASTPIANASEDCRTLTVGAAKIPLYVEDETSGIFINLITVAAKYAELDLKIEILPKKRALQHFLFKQVNTLLPHSSAGTEIDAYKSSPILITRDFAFVRSGATLPKTLEELAGKRVGLTSQYAYPKSLMKREDIDFISQAETDQMNIRMLLAGRYDVAIIEHKSGLAAISRIGRNKVHFDPRHPISELKVWIMFQKDDCGKIFKQKLDKAMSEMKADGSWESIFGQLPDSS